MVVDAPTKLGVLTLWVQSQQTPEEADAFVLSQFVGADADRDSALSFDEFASCYAKVGSGATRAGGRLVCLLSQSSVIKNMCSPVARLVARPRLKSRAAQHDGAVCLGLVVGAGHGVQAAGLIVAD